MNRQEALDYIESIEFDATVSVVSSAKAFFRAVAGEPAVLELYRQAKESGEMRQEILDRIYALAAREINPNYENPNDTALAVLLWLTYYTAPELVRVAALYTALAPKCWYARKLVRRILTPPPVKSVTSRQGVHNQVFGLNQSSGKTAAYFLIPAESKLQFSTQAEKKTAQPETNKYVVGVVS